MLRDYGCTVVEIAACFAVPESVVLADFVIAGLCGGLSLGGGSSSVNRPIKLGPDWIGIGMYVKPRTT